MEKKRICFTTNNNHSVQTTFTRAHSRIRSNRSRTNKPPSTLYAYARPYNYYNLPFMNGSWNTQVVHGEFIRKSYMICNNKTHIHMQTRSRYTIIITPRGRSIDIGFRHNAQNAVCVCVFCTCTVKFVSCIPGQR